tara:strand:- start:7560 stop:7715 length:156 start_codon:yes stop_codon:yes gene_type:complete
MNLSLLFIAKLIASIDLVLPTNNGEVIEGNTTKSLKGRIGPVKMFLSILIR